MNAGRIRAILLQEFYITKRSLEVIMDVFFFSIVSVIVFGFISVFLVGSASSLAAHYLLMGLILWEIIRITQYSMSVSALWNIWSRNLSNMFIAPLTISEYLIAHMLSGTIKALGTFMLASLIAMAVFGFSIFSTGFANLLLFFINLTLFAWSTGIIILGVIFRYGTRIQALAWNIIFLFQPLTAAFFPVSVLPQPLQSLAYLFPPTYIFEAARASLQNPGVDWPTIGIALTQNIIYLIVAIWLFLGMFRKSKQTGQFARNEG